MIFLYTYVQMKKKIITIAGAVGSGKSSTARRVAEELAYEHFSSGDFFRRVARDRNLSIEALNLAAEEQQDIDRRVDELLQRIGREKHHLVIDSRLAYHWIPESFKVYLSLDVDTTAERIFKHINTEGRLSQTGSFVEEVRRNIEIRNGSERKRYQALYGIDVTDTSGFDLVIDTKKYPLETVAEKVITRYRDWKED